MQIQRIQNLKLFSPANNQLNIYTPSFSAKTNEENDAFIKEITDLKEEGYTYADIAKEKGVSRNAIRDRHLKATAREQKINGKIPPEFNQKAQELVELLGLSEKEQSKIVDILIDRPGLRTLDTELIAKNVQEGVKMFEISQKEFVALSLKFPQLLHQKNETLRKNISDSAKIIDITEKDFIKAGLKQPQLFAQKPETLKENIKKSAEVFEMNENEFVKSALKQPQLFRQKPESLKENIAQSAKLFEIGEKEFISAALKQPTLFVQKPETLKENIEQSAKSFGVNLKEFVNTALKQPALFYLKPETLKENIVQSAKLFGISEKEFADIALKKPAIFTIKPETLFSHAKMKQYGKEIKGKPSETPIDSLTLNSTKSIFSDILKYLISDCDNQTLMSGNPEKAVKAYLKDNSERLYDFSIPKGDYAQEFIEFAQHFSKEVLGKNIFKIVIK